MNEPILICPHCDEFLIIKKLNCGIFRHGIFKHNFKQINPHLSKIECDKLFNNNLIYGCGKPFQILIENNIWNITKCDYI